MNSNADTPSAISNDKHAAKPNRRRFLKAGAPSPGASTLAFPMISRGAGNTVLKMQGSWGAGDMLEEYANQYVDIVNDMGKGAGSRSTI